MAVAAGLVGWLTAGCGGGSGGGGSGGAPSSCGNPAGAGCPCSSGQACVGNLSCLDGTCTALAGSGGASGSGGVSGSGGTHVGTGGAGTGTGGANAATCTGTPTSTCAATDCDVLPGCAVTTPGCTGTAAGCSTFDNQATACAAAMGCGMVSEAGNCYNVVSSCNQIGNDLNRCNSIQGCSYNSGNCLGTIMDCTTIKAAAACDNLTACSWTKATTAFCEGVATICESVPRARCEAQSGCHTATATCTGTPTACGSLSPQKCASQPGCVLQGTVGTGSTGGTSGTGGSGAGLPDLIVHSLIAEEVPHLGEETFHFGMTEINRGVVAAGPHAIILVLSADKVIGNQDDVTVSTLTVSSSLDAFGTATIAWPEAYYKLDTLTAAVPSGYFYSGVIVDSNHQVTESEETNNTAIGARMFLGTPINDLAALDVSTDAPSPIAPGDPMQVSVTVKNLGNVDLTSVALSILLSSDATADAADTRFCSATTPVVLAAGAQAVVQVACKAPRVRGAFHLGAELDPANALAESDETNNQVVAATALTFAAPSPDLLIADVTTDITDVPWNGSVQVTATVRNSGVDPAGAFSVAYYLSLDNTLDATDALLCEVVVPGGLGAGVSMPVTKTCTVPPTTYGALKLFAKADSKDDVFETDEGNNVLPGTGVVTVAAPKWDLRSGPFSDNGGQLLRVGQVVTFQLSVSNPGTDSIPGFDVDVRLSTDATISTSDTLVCTMTLGSVPAGTQAGFTFTCPIPSIAAGSYYTGVILDPKDVLVEIDETNNTSVDTVPRPITP